MSVLSLQQHAGGDLTGVHGIEAVLDLLTERLYLVTGGAGPDLLRDLRGQLPETFWVREEEYRPTSPKGENPPRSIRNSMEMSPFADAQQIWSGTLVRGLGGADSREDRRGG